MSAATVVVSDANPTKEVAGCTDSGMHSATMCVATIETAKAIASSGSRLSAASPASPAPPRKTRIAPPAMPSIASDMARKDR